MAEPRSRAELEALVAAGGRPEYLFFWGHRPSPDGRVTASCLSQWWRARFTVAGQAYPTAEHFMMASKARLFGDEERLGLILACDDPREAKALGRQVRPFEPERWARERFGFVVEGNLAKFGQNPDLRAFLLATGGKVLVEASPRDRVWGIGLGRDNPDARDPARWRGENLLGFALMEVRERLRRGG